MFLAIKGKSVNKGSHKFHLFSTPMLFLLGLPLENEVFSNPSLQTPELIEKNRRFLDSFIKNVSSLLATLWVSLRSSDFHQDLGNLNPQITHNSLD